jgi:hypothetical protein
VVPSLNPDVSPVTCLSPRYSMTRFYEGELVVNGPTIRGEGKIEQV